MSQSQNVPELKRPILVALVCLYVCKQHYSHSYERIAKKFHVGVKGGKQICQQRNFLFYVLIKLLEEQSQLEKIVVAIALLNPFSACDEIEYV